jgi:polyisoprenoid-binding protein YceI
MNRLAATLLAGAACALAANAAYAAKAPAKAAPPAAAAPAAATNVPAEVKAGAYTLDAAHGKVTWSVMHIGFSTYVGQFTGVEAKLNLDPKTPAASTLEATVKTDTVGTLNPALDTHLKSDAFLDVVKFPTATFKSTGVTTTGERTADIAGDLTLHGVTKPVVLHATFNKAGPGPMGSKYRAGFDATTEIKMTDFEIAPKMAAFLGENVKLAIEGEFVAAD